MVNKMTAFKNDYNTRGYTMMVIASILMMIYLGSVLFTGEIWESTEDIFAEYGTALASPLLFVIGIIGVRYNLKKMERVLTEGAEVDGVITKVKKRSKYFRVKYAFIYEGETYNKEAKVVRGWGSSDQWVEGERVKLMVTALDNGKIAHYLLQVLK